MDFYVKTRFIPPSDLHDFPIDLPVVAHFFELKGFGPFVFEERGTVGLRKDGLCAISVHGYFQIINLNAYILTSVAYIIFIIDPGIQIHFPGFKTFIVTTAVSRHVSRLPAVKPRVDGTLDILFRR